MVDEFQDTNRLQTELVDLLCGPGTEIFFVGDEFQSIYGFRHADVNVFRERREEAGSVLPLTLNYRSRPEVLAAVNHLFGSDFGDEFQPLAASGDFPDPVFGTPVELLVTDKASYSGTGTHWRRGEARSVAHRRTPSGTSRSCASSAYRPTARPAAATSASSRWPICSPTCGCCTTATTTRRS
jgi:hypothetical protein